MGRVGGRSGWAATHHPFELASRPFKMPILESVRMGGVGAVNISNHSRYYHQYIKIGMDLFDYILVDDENDVDERAQMNGDDVEDEFREYDTDVSVKKRNTPKRMKYWESPWGVMLKDPELNNPWSNKSKKFRLGFRVTFKLFEYIVQIIRDAKLYSNLRQGSVPLELKVLIGLRMLGRGNFGDDIAEMSGLPLSSVYHFFHEFVDKFATCFADQFIKFPDGDDLDEVASLYGRLGLPGSVGSMDCTHLRWTNCPPNLMNSCKGKEPFPSFHFKWFATIQD